MHLSLQWGATTLVKASEEGKVEWVKVLLDAGVHVNFQNKVSAVFIKLQVTKEYLGRCTQALHACTGILVEKLTPTLIL